MKQLFIPILLVSTVMFSCKESSTKKYTSLPEGTSFIDKSNIDSTINPADDFYTYANGKWLKTNEIPASETRWGSFNLLEDFNKNALHELCEEAAKNPGSKNSPSQMVGDLYASGMDSATIEKMGIKAIEKPLAEIDALKTPQDIWNFIAKATKTGMNPLFSYYVGPDDKNVTKNIGNLWQGGLGLPDKDDYFKTGAREVEIRTKYVAHIAKMFALSGVEKTIADANAKLVMSMETNMAKSSMDRVTMRDPYKLYNKFSLADFSKKTPGMDWTAYVKNIGVKNEDSIIVAQPDFYVALSKMIAGNKIEDWKTYFKWHLISGMAPYLSSNFDKENFAFYNATLRGQKEQESRWKRVLEVVDGGVGEKLGQMYTEKYFTAEAKTRMLELVNNLESAFEERIAKLDWMSAETKVKANEKLHSFIKKIGYPDKWKDYTGLEIVKESYVSNIMASNVFDFNFMINKLGKAVDKTEWGMTPPTVNAYYNPAFNEIVFPAGILQYPFFSMEADDAAIYGAIGGVIGHEMTHGFDDQGCQYAADGNLKNWWSTEDKTRFDAKTNQIKNQYDGYTILNNQKVNGSLTLGENIADLGGVTIAYEALMKTKQFKENKLIDGFTPAQRFFLSWAQVWKNNIRDEEASQRLTTDNHSPGIFRCNGPLSNFTPFYTAFGVKEGNKMYKKEEERAVVW